MEEELRLDLEYNMDRQPVLEQQLLLQEEEELPVDVYMEVMVWQQQMEQMGMLQLWQEEQEE